MIFHNRGIFLLGVTFMHMSDALISPVVGGTMIAISAAAIAYSVKKVNTELHIDEGERKIPLMGILGAFIFAAQMINFSIPMTGSSGHLAGALLLCALLGPYAGFLVMACVLTIQALLFADGGLLALGCNIFNMGFYACFIVYPLLYKKMVKQNISMTKITIASIFSAIFSLQLGSFSVVMETLVSGKTELSFFCLSHLCSQFILRLVSWKVWLPLLSSVLCTKQCHKF